jgi:hypothetical protein
MPSPMLSIVEDYMQAITMEEPPKENQGEDKSVRLENRVILGASKAKKGRTHAPDAT